MSLDRARKSAMVCCLTRTIHNAIFISLILLIIFSAQNHAQRFRVNVKSCGLSQPLGRVINGYEIEKVHVPWLVKIIKFVPGKNPRLCGGSIITRNVVLTAAHCIRKRGEYPKALRVFYNTTFGNKGPSIRVERGVVHEYYVSPFRGYDIALLKLVQPLPRFNRFFRPICLPVSYEPTYEGDMLLAGYGGTTWKGKGPRHIMYYLTSTLTEDDCDRALASEWKTLPLSSSKVLCSWNPHQIAWKGDSGSPVTGTLPNGKSVQYGIVSFLTKRQDRLARTVHTRVASFRHWINYQLRNIDDWDAIVTHTSETPYGSWFLRAP